MTSAERPRAILIAAQLPGVDDREFESSLTELGRLVTTLGYEVALRVTQSRSNLSPAGVLGEGKVRELAELTGGSGHTGTTPPRKKDKARVRRESQFAEPDELEQGLESAEPAPRVALVAVDHEITPSQLRNLERATGTSVLDRSGVIIEIFHRHARSREAKLEVEIARLSYTAPRLREAPRGKERQQGRGAGEAAIELDRRRIRDRIAELKEQLAAIAREQGVRRAQRRQARRVALVGYTNAGKSSLMRALTGSDVHVEDKLFATLDTTVRALWPEARPRILVSDTVGFIRKLPHDLVASFKSTLDEAGEASLLLQIIDSADPDWPTQLEVTREVLSEIGAAGVPTVLVMNKIDKLAENALAELQGQKPDAWFVCARSDVSVQQLREKIVAFFEAGYDEAEFLVPYDRQRMISTMHESARVLEEKYDERGVLVRLRSDAETLGRLRAELGS
ncbi:MAG TPA: GTPase HflX [Polyangiaceae bacterium]|nr:GTPase HflX [Polyangiaceae bacterium]